MTKLNTSKNIIYHYSNINAFHSIIQNKTLWLSCADSMNDSEEVEYAYKILATVHAEMYPNKPVPEWIQDKRVQDLVFLCSLSKAVNIESQWQKYADKEQGVAIG